MRGRTLFRAGSHFLLASAVSCSAPQQKGSGAPAPREDATAEVSSRPVSPPTQEDPAPAEVKADRRAPAFPESLGRLNGVPWQDVVWGRGGWVKEGTRVEEWSATARLASYYPGASRPVEFSFDSEEALAAVVERWGRPLVRGTFKCHELWFNRALGLRAEVELEERASDGACPPRGKRKLVLRLGPYAVLGTLLPSADGRFPFEAARRLIGRPIAELDPHPLIGGDAHSDRGPPVEDSESDLDLKFYESGGTVQRVVVRSGHSPGLVELDRVSRAFEAAFGPPTRQDEVGPIWREYRKGTLRIEVGRGLGVLTITDAACDLWSPERLRMGRESAVGDWIRTRAAAEGVSEDRFVVRQTYGFGGFSEATVERSVDACNKELFRVRWEKPECAPPRTTALPVLATCCDGDCTKDPSEPLLRLLDATTDSDFRALGQLFPPSGRVQIREERSDGKRTSTLSRGQLNAKSIEPLPTWVDVFWDRSCNEDESDSSVVVCSVSTGSRFHQLTFRNGRLHSVDVQEARHRSH